MLQIEVPRDQVFPVILSTLVQFDKLCMELEVAREASSPQVIVNIEKMKATLNGYMAEGHLLKADFEACQIECNALAGNFAKNEKKLKKLHDHVQEDIDRITSIQDKIHALEEKIASIERWLHGGKSLDDIKQQYETTFEIIKNFRQTIPALYADAERETGIHFFTSFK